MMRARGGSLKGTLERRVTKHLKKLGLNEKESESRPLEEGRGDRKTKVMTMQ